MKLNTLLTALTAASIYFFHPTAMADKAVALDKVIAVVNNSIITTSQLNQQMIAARQQLKANNTPAPSAAALRKQVLNRMIDQELQLQVAKMMGITVDNTEVDKAIAEVASRNGISTTRLREELEKQGVNFAQYRKDIEQQMIASQVQQRAVAGKVNVSEQEINDMMAKLAKQPARENASSEFQVQDILIALSATPTTEEIQQQKQKAEALLAQLRKGEDFQRIAAEQSSGQQAFQGGDLGWRKLNDLPELFAAQVKNMKTGDIAGPLRAGNGFHLIKLAGVRSQNNEQAQRAITETKVQQIFLKNDPLSTPTANRLRLDSIRNDIVHGKSFAQLAAENSQDPTSVQKGGLMGWVRPGTVDPTFEEIMNKLKVNELSEPFASSYGWHIIQVLGRRQIADRKELLRDQARQIIFRRKAEAAVQTWLQEIRSQAYIKIKDGKQ